jgi:hypothetical protein
VASVDSVWSVDIESLGRVPGLNRSALRSAGRALRNSGGEGVFAARDDRRVDKFPDVGGKFVSDAGCSDVSRSRSRFGFMSC